MTSHAAIKCGPVIDDDPGRCRVSCTKRPRQRPGGEPGCCAAPAPYTAPHDMSKPTLPADVHEGLLEVVRACAEQHKADVILHALEVACAANAIGVGSPCAPEASDDVDPS